MKVFVLEDDGERNNVFSKLFVNQELMISNNVDLSFKILSLIKFDYIFLDHDLGGKQLVNSLEQNTGYNLATKIHLTKNTLTPIIIHSYNPVGARNMEAILKRNEINSLVYTSPFMGDNFKQILSHLKK